MKIQGPVRASSLALGRVVSRRRRNKSRKLRWIRANPFVVDLENLNYDTILMKVEEDLAEVGYSSRPDDSPKLYRKIVQCIKSIRGVAGIIAENNSFANFMVLMVTVNTITMGLATMSFIADDDAKSTFLTKLDFIFLCMFTVEFGLHFIHKLFRVFLDNGLFFDFLIVTLSWIFESVTILRSFRIARVFRLFRSLTLLKRLKSVRVVMSALLNTIPRLKSIIMLMSLNIYIFSILFTSLYKSGYDESPCDYENVSSTSLEVNISEHNWTSYRTNTVMRSCTEEIYSEDYFGSLPASSFTMFQIMTMDNYVDVARELYKNFPLSWVPFMTNVFISAFVFPNLFIAVLSDATSNIGHDEKESDSNLEIEYDAYLNNQISDLNEKLKLLENLHEQSKQAVDTLEGYMRNYLERSREAEILDRRGALDNNEEQGSFCLIS